MGSPMTMEAGDGGRRAPVPIRRIIMTMKEAMRRRHTVRRCNCEGLGSMARVLLARGVNNYIILAGPDALDLDERLGYCGADMIIYAQTLG